VREANEGWAIGIDRSLQIGDGRSERGLVTQCRVGVAKTAKAQFGSMFVLGPDERADDGKAVHLLRQLGEVFADLDAGDGGLDGREFPTDFHRCVRFQIPDIEVGRATGEEDHDDRLVFAAIAAGGIGSQQVGQGEAAESEGADGQEGASAKAVAESCSVTGNSQHR